VSEVKGPIPGGDCFFLGHGSRPFTSASWHKCTARMMLRSSALGVLMWSEREQGHSAEQVPVSAYDGSFKNPKDLKEVRQEQPTTSTPCKESCQDVKGRVFL